MPSLREAEGRSNLKARSSRDGSRDETIRDPCTVGKDGETMNQAATLLVSTFTTLRAIISPLESLPVFLRLLEGKDEQAHRRLGAIATVLGMASLVQQPLAQMLSLAAVTLAVLATMATTYLFLAYADMILGRIGSRGIDAATRIVGFFVAAMGTGLISHGVAEAIQTHGLAAAH
jgi:small neutral amino acid transporter SnatA (MarC family)